MDTTHENSKTIKWNDFLDVNEQDDFEFRLLDDGLGFHQKKAIEERTAVKRKPVTTRAVRPLQNKRSNRVPDIPSLEGRPIRTKSKAPAISSRLGDLPEVSMPEVAMPEVSMPELKTGYATEKKTAKPLQKVKLKKKIVMASVEARMGAFILDLLFLGIAGVLFALAGSFTVGVTIDAFASKLMSPQFAPLMIGLFLSSFIFYFSLLDCDQSFGKQIMQIKVVDKETRKSARFGQCFTRSFLSVLLIPVLFSLQDSMSDTEVIKCS